MIDRIALVRSAMDCPDGSPAAELAKSLCVTRRLDPYMPTFMPIEGTTLPAWRAVLYEAKAMYLLGSMPTG